MMYKAWLSEVLKKENEINILTKARTTSEPRLTNGQKVNGEAMNTLSFVIVVCICGWVFL